MELTASELWTQILDSARSGLPEQTFRTWLAGTEAFALSDDLLLVEVPSDFHEEWLKDKYGPMLEEITRRIVGRPLEIEFRCTSPPPKRTVPSLEVRRPDEGGVQPERTPSPSPSPKAPARPPASLNDRYSFDRFVVGNNNQLAAAACHAVAEKPARMYNPLFIYGGVGLGKTHLMHAIGNHIVRSDLEKRVAYVPSEQFTNELVTAIQEGTTPRFRRRYRQMDLLLVDDVHFLEGKERTQEEFFHTFNALYDAHRQIVLTSDRPPKEIPGLEDRLVSRFEWGLVADIKPPDYETRVAILRKKADDDDLTVDPDVLDFIARSCTSSVRELEGAVIKLLAYSSLRNQEITVSMAQNALEGMLRSDAAEDSGPTLTAEEIRQKVAEAWGVKVSGLQSRRRTKDLTVPRQVAMYLIRELLDLSLVRIGELFGGRDHSTVIHSLKKVEETMEEDPEYRKRVGELRDQFQSHA